MDEMIAYCGVDCAECADFRNGRCPGCRRSTWEEGDECPPVSCCREKGIPVCGACGQFPCQMMKEFYDESESHRAAFRRMEEYRKAQEEKRNGNRIQG
jgi:hypothetical protein